MSGYPSVCLSISLSIHVVYFGALTRKTFDRVSGQSCMRTLFENHFKGPTHKAVSWQGTRGKGGGGGIYHQAIVIENIVPRG